MKQIIFATFLILSIASCKNSNGPTVNQRAEKLSRDTLLRDIALLEQKISTQQTIDYKFAAALVTAYQNFYNNYPKDALAPDYVYKAADVSMNAKQSEKAIELFKKFCEVYPNKQKASFALFMQAFVYETQLKDLSKAKEIYMQVAEQYPGTKIAEDAKASINNLGKSDEELIKEFEKKNKAQ